MKKLKTIVITCLAASLMLGIATAASVTWNSPTGISGTNDISHDGAFVDGTQTAINSTNTLTFGDAVFTGASGAYSGNTGTSTSGYISWYASGTDSSGLTGSGPAFTADYNQLIHQDIWLDWESVQYIALNNLTVGDQYQVQIWVNAGSGAYKSTFTADNAVTLNSYGSAGNLGQYVLGTFTADATTENITFSTPGYGILNAVQLRDVTGAVIPTTLEITQNPVDAVAYAGQTATLSVGAVVHQGNQTNVTYQWLTNGVAIVGGTLASYTTPPITTNYDSSILYKVIVSYPSLTSLTSSVAVVKYATTITWSDPQTISGTNDISSLGTYVDGTQTSTHDDASNLFTNTLAFGDAVFTTASAAYVGNTGTSAGGFINWYASGSQADGNLGSGSGFTDNYNQLIHQNIFLNWNQSAQIGLTNLTIGHAYLIQIWANQSANYPTTFSAGNAVTLNTAGGAGGLGQYVNGTFTANATSKTIGFSSSAYAILNAIQLRDVTGELLIIQNPTTTNAYVGQTVTFTVVAAVLGENQPGVTYQWRTNGVAVAGATSDSYTTPTLTTSYDPSILYSVVVSTPGKASLTSSSASVNLQAALFWSVPAPIAGDNDISHLGTFVDATETSGDTFGSLVFGDATFTGASGQYIPSSGGGFIGTSVNGYLSWNINGSQMYGNAGVGGSFSDQYNFLIGQNTYLNLGTMQPIILNDLTAGHTYQLQIWVNQGYENYSTFLSGRSVTLSSGGGGSGSSLGQNVTGTFTALGTSQSIIYGGVGYPILNAMQLRDVTGISQLIIGEVPINATAYVGQSVTFNVVAEVVGGNQANITYQWEKNGIAIAGANMASYTTDPVAINYDTNTVYNVEVSYSGLTNQTTSGATISILPSSAPVTWQNVQIPAGGADVCTAGTNALATFWSGVANAYEINGVVFTDSGNNSQSQNGITISVPELPNLVTNSFYTGSQTLMDPDAANYAAVLGCGAYNTNHQTLASLTMTGLNVGQKYQVQLWVYNSETYWGEQMTEVINSSTADINVPTFARGLAGAPGNFVIGTFTANASSQTFNLTDLSNPVKLGVQINAIQVRTIPNINTNPTNITVNLSNHVMQLAWPQDHTGWTLLVQTNNLAAGVSSNTNDWERIPGSETINQTNITLNPSIPGEYYRLVYP